MLQKKNNKKGFTLAELLIVVAIIGVLVAISIPVFTKQLEKSREATDAANLRAAYATAAAAVLESETGVSAGPVAMSQTTEGFQTIDTDIGGVSLSTLGGAKKNVSYYVNVSPEGTVSIDTSATSGYTEVNPTDGSSTKDGSTN